MPTTSEQIAEAMKKLDAKLVAYLAGEEQHALGSAAGKHLAVEDVVVVDDVVAVAAAVDDLADEDDNLEPNRLDDEPANVFQQLNSKLQQQQEHNAAVAADYQQQQLQLFTAIESIGIQMEALTLEPEGTRRMELLQNDLRPIFTIECQLSQELIKLVPRSDMFHLMQFESEKFHSLTQCTRFGQAAERKVKLSEAEVFASDANNDAYNEFKQRLQKQQNAGAAEYESNDTAKPKMPNLGRIHFLVWWREPGTCLNEMLGSGVLELNEFYNANLLEQCKRIKIERRNTHLANIYLKINLQVPQHKRAQLTAANNVPMSVANQQYQHAGKQQQQQTGDYFDGAADADNDQDAAAAAAAIERLLWSGEHSYKAQDTKIQ